MKNDQEKIIYPFMQLPTMFETNLKGDQQLCYLVFNGNNLNSFQMPLQLEPCKHTTLYLHFRGISYAFPIRFNLIKHHLCNIVKFEFICGFWICKFNCNYHIWMECSTHQYHEHHHIQLIMCLCIVPYVDHFVCIVCSDRSGAGTRDHPLRWRPRYRNLVSKASSPPPIDHVDKIPFSLSFPYAWLGCHLVSILTA